MITIELKYRCSDIGKLFEANWKRNREKKAPFLSLSLSFFILSFFIHDFIWSSGHCSFSKSKTKKSVDCIYRFQLNTLLIHIQLVLTVKKYEAFPNCSLSLFLQLIFYFFFFSRIRSSTHRRLLHTLRKDCTKRILWISWRKFSFTICELHV